MPSDVTQQIVRSAQPMSGCSLRIAGEIPPGQETIEGELSPQGVNFTAFVIQPTLGSVAVVEYPADNSGFSAAGIIDADPFTPGRNAIPVGTLPVDIVTSTDGCYVITPNGGSCDFSVLSVDSALDRSVPAEVSRVQLFTSGGERLLAKAADAEVPPPIEDIGFVCPEKPQGPVYVAYPNCNWVAAVDPATGVALAGIRFGDGTVEITDGNVSCADECGDGVLPIAFGPEIGGPGRPMALKMEDNGKRLFIAADNLPALTIVELDDAFLPAAVSQIEVDGDVGLLKVAVSPEINMGGSTGLLGAGSGGIFQFVYAIATDATIRVIEVRNRLFECDTQVDPRYLRNESDIGFLSCMPVGDPSTPPRRQEARSPGIHIPRVRSLEVQDWNAIPLDVAFAETDVDPSNNPCVDGADNCPIRMVGYYAFVATTEGVAFVVNVDDDTYPDFEVRGDPLAVSMPLAIAHQLRDVASVRDGIPADGSCAIPDPSLLARGPRLAVPVTVFFDRARMVSEKDHLLPIIRADLCLDTTAGDNTPPVPTLASELGFTAPVDVREAAFPDLMGLRNEVVQLTWEGLFSLDSISVAIDGPAVRTGLVDSSGGDRFKIRDGTNPFCRMGLEPYDIAVLSGCDPARGNAQCGIGETCFVHPETPSALLGSGVCVLEADADRLSGACRDFMVSRHRYSVLTTDAGEIELTPRRSVLDSTPIAGCDSADQCKLHYEETLREAVPENPLDFAELACDELNACPTGFTCQGETCVVERNFAWACEPDPTRRPGKNWCQIRCESSDDCEDGDFCGADGFCSTGVVPPQECVNGVVRYQTRVGEAFAMVGELSGFQHNRVMDPDTGACMDSTTPDPLRVGRVPLDAPDCVSDDPTVMLPNPCKTRVMHTDFVPALAPTEIGGQRVCVQIDGEATQRVATREVDAIRVQTLGMTFHLVKPTTRGDGECNGDEGGTLAPFPAVHRGTQVRMSMVGGFVPMIAAAPVPVALPGALTASPDSTLWLLDQGDRSSGIQGQLIRFQPNDAITGFSPSPISLGR